MNRFMMALLAAMVCAGSAARGETTSLDDIRALMKEANYPQALQKIAGDMALKGPAAKGIDRGELFMLKAECHLQTKAVTMAIEAYQHAAKESTSGNQRMLAEAHEMLVRQSKAFMYTKKTGREAGKPPVGIDILNVESRKQAFAAMLADELATNDAKIKAAKTAKTLPPVLEVIKVVSTLEGVETAATGSADKTKELLGQVAEQSKKLISDGLRTMSKRVGDIDKEANSYKEIYVDSFDPGSTTGQYKKVKAYQKKGLTNPQGKELQELSATCDKLTPAIEMIAAGLKSDEKAFAPMVDEAARMRKDVDRLLDEDYTQTYKNLPGK